MQNTQICGINIFAVSIFEQDINPIEFKKRGPGRGHTKDGSKKTWRKKYYFEDDLLAMKLKQLGHKEFKNHFSGTSAADIDSFWKQIRENCIRPRETEIHARNKLILWLDKLHNQLSWKKIKSEYKIGAATAIGYVNDVLDGIIKSFKLRNMITFPSEEQRIKMTGLMVKKGALMPNALFTMDGKHALCTGRNKRERRSVKYKWLPCFNVMFIIERVFGTVCAFNLDKAASKHDITVLRESEFFRNVDATLNGWILMADKGYVGTKNSHIAASMKTDSNRKDWYSKEFWKIFNGARVDSERVFAHFFYNKFTQLSKWPGKGSNSFIDWAKNVTCCIILYNYTKLRNAHAI